eukprot:15434812-Alexandrium_andersonii.AAC.1
MVEVSHARSFAFVEESNVRSFACSTRMCCLLVARGRMPLEKHADARILSSAELNLRIASQTL